MKKPVCIANAVDSLRHKDLAAETTPCFEMADMLGKTDLMFRSAIVCRRLYELDSVVVRHVEARSSQCRVRMLCPGVVESMAAADGATLSDTDVP